MEKVHPPLKTNNKEQGEVADAGTMTADDDEVVIR